MPNNKKTTNESVEVEATKTAAEGNVEERTTCQANANPLLEKVRIKIPRLKGANADQRKFVSVNGKKFMIVRGEYVEVPRYVANIIEQSERQAEIASAMIEEYTSED